LTARLSSRTSSHGTSSAVGASSRSVLSPKPRSLCSPPNGPASATLEGSSSLNGCLMLPRRQGSLLLFSPHVICTREYPLRMPGFSDATSTGHNGVGSKSPFPYGSMTISRVTRAAECRYDRGRQFQPSASAAMRHPGLSSIGHAMRRRGYWAVSELALLILSARRRARIFSWAGGCVRRCCGAS